MEKEEEKRVTSEKYFKSLNHKSGSSDKPIRPDFISEEKWQEYYDKGIAIVGYENLEENDIAVFLDNKGGAVIYTDRYNGPDVHYIIYSENLYQDICDYIEETSCKFGVRVKLNYVNINLIDYIKKNRPYLFNMVYKQKNGTIGVELNSENIKNVEDNININHIKKSEVLLDAVLQHLCTEHKLLISVWNAFVIAKSK